MTDFVKYNWDDYLAYLDELWGSDLDIRWYVTRLQQKFDLPRDIAFGVFVTWYSRECFVGEG